jgi:uncharacterized protein YtpQ (UPF0354 family)
MFTKEEFIEFFVLRFGQNFKQYNLKLRQHENDHMKFDIEITVSPQKESYRQVVNLTNTWNNYNRTQDIHIIEGLIKTFEDLLRQTMTKSADSVSMERLFPLVRKEKFHQEFAEGEQELYVTALAAGIEMVYAFDSPDYVQFVNGSDLPAGITLELVKEKAKENMKKQGWIKHDEYDEKACGIFRNFIDYEHVFNAQFLIPEMYQAHLGDFFYVSFPNTHITLTLKPKQYGLQEALERFKELSFVVNRNMENPIVSSVYRVQGGWIERVF